MADQAEYLRAGRPERRQIHQAKQSEEKPGRSSVRRPFVPVGIARVVNTSEPLRGATKLPSRN